jgi:putative transcriptional regulator
LKCSSRDDNLHNGPYPILQRCNEECLFHLRDKGKHKSHLWDFNGSSIPAVAQRLAKQLGSFLRKKRGDLTYAQFAKKVGLSDSTLHRMEMAQQNVTLNTLELLSRRLKCSVGEMLGE